MKLLKKIMKCLFFQIRILISIAVLIAILAICINIYVINYAKSSILTVEQCTTKKPFDCILILGASVLPDKTPSHMLEDRLLKGIELYKKGISDKIIMSGDHGSDSYDEVTAMKNFAIAHGVPSEDIFLDHAGFSTYESMYRAKHVFNVERIVVVTQQYHLYRAVYIGNKIGIDTNGVASDLRTYAGQRYRDLREILARNKDFITSLFEPKIPGSGSKISLKSNGDATNQRN